MGVDLVEASRRVGRLQDAAHSNGTVGQIVQCEPGANAMDRFRGKVQAAPECAAANQLLAVRSLAQSDLEHLLAAPVDRIEAFQDVPLDPIPVCVVVLKELLGCNGE